MKRVQTMVLVIFATAAAAISSAQLRGPELIDSLMKALPAMHDDSNKVNVLYKIGGFNLGGDLAIAIANGEQALKLSEKINWKPGIAKANILLGIAWRRSANYDKANKYLLRSLDVYTALKDKFGMASCEINIANVHCDKGDIASAMEYYYKAIDVYQELGKKEEVAGLLNNIGLLYFDEGDTDKALEIYLRALKLQQEAGTTRGLGMLLDNIGLAYISKKEYQKGLDHSLKALQANREAGDGYHEGISLGNVGNAYLKLGNVPLAIRYMQEAVKLNEETENYNTLAMNLQYLGNAYVTLVKNEGETLTTNSIVDSNIAGSDPIPSGRTARLKKAVAYLEKAIGLSRDAGIADGLQNCYGDLSLAYRLLGDYKTSLTYADSFQLMRDSTYSSDNRVKMAKLATKGEQELKEKQIALNKLEIQKKKNERIYFGIGVGMLLTIVSGLFFSRKTIQKEKNVSESLLLNILPAEVARELKQKGASDAKLFDDVTVLFTDFVGFSRVSEQLTPQQLVDELHTCFTAFDGIMGRHHVEKIKTVGDAYLAVSGLPLARTDHAESVVKAAMEIRDFMLARHQLLGDRTFQIRIGIHTGSVVAGIVGIKKFAYDVWGDTVNTAARMEQNSLPGKINVSADTYEILSSKFNFEYRGEIEAKNKGMLKMYFLN